MQPRGSHEGAVRAPLIDDDVRLVVPRDHPLVKSKAKIVFDAAFEGDAVAIDILRTAGKYLGDMVIAVARKLDMTRQPFELVTAGSVFKGSSPVLKDCMMARVHEVCPEAAAVTPIYEPVVGALLMALETDIDMNAALYENLTESLRQAEKRYNVEFTAK